MGALILPLADLFEDQVVFTVVVHGFLAFPVVLEAKVYLKAVDFAVSPVGSKIDVMVLHQLLPVVLFQEHTEIALLNLLVLQDALLFLYPFFHNPPFL